MVSMGTKVNMPPKSVCLRDLVLKYSTEKVGVSGRVYDPMENPPEPWDWVGEWIVLDFEDYYGNYDCEWDGDGLDHDWFWHVGG